MRPHHGCEEGHPGCWKGMESNNNGEQHRHCSINQRKEVIRSEQKIWRLGGRSKQGGNNAPSSQEELAQYTTSTRIRTTGLVTTRKGMRAKTLNGAIRLHRHKREEPQNKRSTEGKSVKTSALLKRSTLKRTEYPKARRNRNSNERTNARSSWRNDEQTEESFNEC